MSKKPKILLLGDSIRMSYQPLVERLLHEKAVVVGPADNGQFSLYTLSSLRRWLEELGSPDIIHWNNGLHDAGHNPKRSPVQISMDDYRANLQLILSQLVELTPQIIWATTTPVHPCRALQHDQWWWRNEEIDLYNKTAFQLMAESNVPVNDLHQLVWENLDGYLSDDQLHLSEAGQEACAKAVANSIAVNFLGTEPERS